MTDEYLVLDGYAFTNESVARNFTVLSDFGILLNLHKCAYFRVITNLTAVQIDKPGELHVLSEFHVRRNREVAVAHRRTAIPVPASDRSAASSNLTIETQPLSDGERQEILQSRISYYPNDLAVIGWNAAFIYDSPVGAETAVQLLQYANSQLLEFRHYDELLTKQLEQVYAFLDRGGRGLWSRWRTAKAASKLHTVLLDVNELTERADNAIKFLSDMFSARLYKLAALKVGVPDYKDLVQQKLQTAEELYRFMVDEFNQSRAFVLELMVVIILIIELVYFFRGKPI